MRYKTTRQLISELFRSRGKAGATPRPDSTQEYQVEQITGKGTTATVDGFPVVLVEKDCIGAKEAKARQEYEEYRTLRRDVAIGIYTEISGKNSLGSCDTERAEIAISKANTILAVLAAREEKELKQQEQSK